jgi:hypothetical protein
VRRVLAQPLAFAQRLVHQPGVVLQVAQPAVHQLRALRRGARRQIVALDQRRAQAAGGGVECGAGAGDATTDDEHVERFLLEPAHHEVALERRVGHRSILRKRAHAVGTDRSHRNRC